MENMRILGIDPGTGRTGWGVINHEVEDRIVYVSHGCVVTPQEHLMQDRLLTLHEELIGIIQKFTPDCIVVEQIFFGINARTAISVSQARGVVMLACAQGKLPMFEYTPLAVKHLVAGSGKTDKKEMQKVVRSLLDIDDSVLSFSAKDKAFDDAADALAIAIHHSWKVSGKDQIILSALKETKKIADKKARDEKKKSRGVS